MKLLQINVTANWGSTGKIAEQIGLSALSEKWQSYIAYGRNSNRSSSKLIKVGRQLDVYLHYIKQRIFDNEGLASIRARIKEFTSSPIYGIGFCVVDPRYDAVNKSTGQIEPGSSWLTIASMTGLLGLITFLSIVVSSFKKVVKIKNDFYSMLFAGCLTFFIFHMLAEGYIMAPGSYLNFIFWLLIGSIWGVYFIEHKGLVFKNIWK